MIQFPIQGEFREIFLIVEMIIVVLNLQFGIIFLNRFLKQKRVKYNMHLAWTVLFFCLAATYVLLIFSDFYVSINDRPFLLNFSYIFIGTGQAFLSFNIEKENQSENHLITIIILSLSSFLIINLIFNLIISTPIAMIFWGLFLVLLIIYGNKYLSKIRQTWKLNIYGFIIGAVLTILGWVGISDLGMNILGIEFRLLGDIFIVIGMSLITLFFIGLPRLSEIDYLEKIKRLFVMHDSGRAMYEYSFEKEKEPGGKGLKGALYAGGLTTITQMVSNLIQSKEHLEIVDHGDVKIMFDYGHNIVNVLIVDEVLEILKNKLKNLTKDIENLYQDVLSSWDGNLSAFTLLETIIQQNFET
ncbi:MAG: hypothetical protein HWN67_15595 [Candidatus Helarchaeota archaeon]|nr:hypothetical protein [Candidatus Helarchaeota archaeon]